MMKFNYSKQKYDFGKAYCQVLNKDGSTIQPVDVNYVGLDRSKIKAINVIVEGKILYTLQIKGNKFYYRVRNITPQVESDKRFSINNPKRCFILQTEGKIAFIWDSGEIKEFKNWGDIVQYKAIVLTENDK